MFANKTTEQQKARGPPRRKLDYSTTKNWQLQSPLLWQNSFFNFS